MCPVVMVVASSPATRDLIVQQLAAAAITANTYRSGAQFLSSCDCDKPGCIIIDLTLDDMDCTTLVGKLRARGCMTPFFAVGTAREGDQLAAMRCGAIDALELPIKAERLLALVSEACDRDAATRERRTAKVETQRLIDGLTPREQQVMELVVAGQLTKQIARMLDISPRTVAVHRSNIMRKMNVDSLAALIRRITKARDIE